MRWCLSASDLFIYLFVFISRGELVYDVSAQTVQNAVTTLCGTEQLIGSLPEVKWAQQVRTLAAELQEESLHVIVQHLPEVTRTQAFQELRRVRRCCTHADAFCSHIGLVGFSVSDCVTEGGDHQRTHPAEEAVFSHKTRCDRGQLLPAVCCCE